MAVELIDHKNDNSKEFPDRATAEENKEELLNSNLGYEDDDLEISMGASADGGSEVVEDTPAIAEDGVPEKTSATHPEDFETPEPAETQDALEQLGESIENDPLDVLPGYMITQVDGKPSLNKRGVSVLAYHYDIDVKDRTVVAYPHENDYETAVVEIMVKGPDGRSFSGIGEAHVDETDKHQLLRMAETRAYKRAVIFATGTGIVGYQEITSQL